MIVRIERLRPDRTTHAIAEWIIQDDVTTFSGELELPAIADSTKLQTYYVVVSREDSL